MIVTARLPRRRARLCLGVAAAALLCCGALTILLGRGMVPASGSAQPSPKGIKSNEDRVAYLQAWGWQVSGEPIVTQDMRFHPVIRIMILIEYSIILGRII